MTNVFVVRNQFGHYWGKAKRWVDGSIPRAVMRTAHEDEAINTLVELSSRDVELRGEVASVELSERAEPVIEPSQIPLLEAPGDEDETSSPVAEQPEAEPTEST